ncbi:MAG TPA: HAMP domain-containing histidine kinase [Candidatus Scatavimonas merdigallinarum]|uniref:histidine kinase n=1 Tax=Candidatus Scatavimonas merdigallinarum TaxID=2840914 RepID=A0A9D0ZG09_9FIRM|nr:HAMP domain-containing histidine kinase [Candidatus Scatavimonas merdigallinarum]
MKLSIKSKITIWFTAMMLLLCMIVFVFIAIISSATAAQDSRRLLMGTVQANMDAVDYDDGKLDIDDDFTFFDNGVYIQLFEENGALISGYAPYDVLYSQPFTDGATQQVSTDGGSYFIYDRRVPLDNGQTVWIRGAVSAKNGLAGLSAVTRAAFIALPLLVILASAGGYLLARRSLNPIRKMNKTAEEIGYSGDLSKRIEINTNGDELHQLAETFNCMFARLQTNFEAERQFTSDASHELRTPVSIILAQCEYAFENASEKEELYEAIGAIQKQGYRISHLIASLLAFTRLEQGTETPAMEKTHLSKLVSSVCAEQKTVAEKNISLSAQITPDIIMAANPALFTRMLNNLIQNAYRYGVENGHIWVSLLREANTVVLTVADDGIGIEAEEIPKIWNRFYRSDKARSRSDNTGLGLGLAMVKQIAQLHKGKVFVESTPGTGSAFTVQFSDSF